MSIAKALQLFALLSSLVFAYEDNDIDGVDDALDLCPNTSFDQLVDVDGCPLNQSYYGEFTLQVANEMSFDAFDDRTNDYNVFLNYQYHQWNFSLSNGQQTTIDSNNKHSSTTGDVYLNGGYLFSSNTLQTKFTLGTKIATADETIGTGENDYSTTLYLTYPINEQQNIFSQLNYTLSGDSATMDYKNSFGYTFGTGYMLTPSWYTAISYNHADSIYPDGENYEALALLNSYTITPDIFMNLNYTKGLDKLSYEQSVSIGFGIGWE